jgi:hypothetical protein
MLQMGLVVLQTRRTAPEIRSLFFQCAVNHLQEPGIIRAVSHAMIHNAVRRIGTGSVIVSRM